MSRLREYMDLIQEMSQPREEVDIQRISSMFGGGYIESRAYFNSDNIAETYSYSYVNPKIAQNSSVIKFDVDANNKVIAYDYRRYPEGMEYGTMKDEQVRTNFASLVTPYLNLGSMKEAESITEKTASDAMKGFMVFSDKIIASRKGLKNNANP